MNPILLIIIFTIVCPIYFMPTIVAFLRDHKNTAAIFIINFFLGWTLLGWVMPLAWAFIAQTRYERYQ